MNRYWGESNHIWNSSGDTVYLRTAHGTLLRTGVLPGSKSSRYC